MKNLIYMIRNTVNGKVYIGQTRQGLARRRGEHVHRFNLGERDHKLYRAMRKYGHQAFEFSVLCHAFRPEDLNELERAVIAQHNSFNRGYNMTCGGDAISDETRAKLSAMFKGRSAPWAKDTWARRRENGTDKIDMRQFVPSGADNSLARSYLIQDPAGQRHTVRGLKAFCKERGLTPKAMYDTLDGKQRHHKGYSLLARLNDQSASSYTQAGGNGAQTAALAA